MEYMDYQDYLEYRDMGVVLNGVLEINENFNVLVEFADPDNPWSIYDDDYSINLATASSYLSTSQLNAEERRIIPEAGWTGKIPCVIHQHVTFLGKTVVKMGLRAPHLEVLASIHRDRLFGLVYPYGNPPERVSNYGVLCEVCLPLKQGQDFRNFDLRVLTCRRFRLTKPIQARSLLEEQKTIRMMNVVVLPDVLVSNPLSGVRFANQDSTRYQHHARRLDAVLTPWPLFVYDMFNSERLERAVRAQFKTKHNMPDDLVSLSFYAASYLLCTHQDRLDAFMMDNVLQRLHMVVQRLK
ncbi:Protein cereblon homolog [Eumeta japonica]|uniref:Protein cereblon homolog n=1 Tax=Eumeta variegata TaxID=151549 RepID=A0A4C1ZZJ0_EUMVA|nr:Protein cereblon homolog [Eumeta japonica]